MLAQDSHHQGSTSESFYANLPVLPNFASIADINNFQDFPEDWLIIITDVAESTEAIAAGKYKEVNLLGACSITAILNIVENLEVPFVFGGDGASILIPERFRLASEYALLALQKMAQAEFKLFLRVGIVPISAIGDRAKLKVAKLEISENYYQAILRGGGITYATDLVKNKATSHLYSPQHRHTSQAIANLAGLECRWQDIPSRHEEIVSLIVSATAPSQSQIDHIYAEVINQIERIYGSERECNPIIPDTLQLTFRKKKLLPETRVFRASQSWLLKYLYLWKLRFINLLGILFMRFNINIAGFNWGDYKQIVAESTDFRKFDDILRMVISGTFQQRHRLEKLLAQKFQDGRLVYGIHVTDRALMTCLVFERDGKQVHFIDGADGGYALAAKDLKERMRS
jgi:hypothetical protein